MVEEAVDARSMGARFIERVKSICGNTSRILYKYDEPTDPRHGYIPPERPLEVYLRYGMIVVDKPPGPTSHEVVAWIKRMLGVSRAGHGGTLEPQPALWGLRGGDILR
ncbi:H/ACA RNA-protein complex component Cbf5p [Aeropyrum camini]|uniref:H/ACA RNA-protein complex component Cbf5p n=1 Tax=Aeropyrum camini SY1 = JCM 12091 TaxID=1198449 RepID=U3T9E8_9CREN|nr:H/ACA RNA-protein complex component Cbf5p [Aeropyrum camini]BAN90122.1 H/ACA RNA-protein complex component Cbf5p [Aeropyrum camini SY1 = JCM 12091]